MSESKTYNLLNLSDVNKAIKEVEKRQSNLVKINKQFLVDCSEWLKLEMDLRYQQNGGTYPLIDESTNNFIYNISSDFEVTIISTKGNQYLTLKSISQQTTYAEFGIGAVGRNYSKNTDIDYKYDVDSPYKKTPKSGGSRFWYHKGPDDLTTKITSGKPGLYFAYDAFWDMVHLGVINDIYNKAVIKINKGVI